MKKFEVEFIIYKQRNKDSIWAEDSGDAASEFCAMFAEAGIQIIILSVNEA